MNLKIRLTIMNFLQFFIWGAWLITIGGYWFKTMQWSGTEFGAIFSTMGIASIFMPALAGIIADRYISAEKLLGIFHVIGAGILCYLPQIDNPSTFFVVMLLNMIFYMPTISLSITVAYSALQKNNLDIVKVYPPIRVWGTVGFIVAMWVVSLLKIETSPAQFYVAALASISLGLYSFTLPSCGVNKGGSSKTWVEALGFDAFKLFKQKKMALFFIFSMLLGASLQLTNAYGDIFLHEFDTNPLFKDSIAVKYPAIIMSISQVSETLFILAIPFFLKRFGIKNVMLMSMFAWVLRFGLLGIGDPGSGLVWIIISCIVYGMAFDFFNISGSLYVESQTDEKIRASGQGLFMMMTNGFGAVLGSSVSGVMIDQFFTDTEGLRDWPNIWFAFAAYSLVVAILFAVLFKHKHNPKDIESFSH
ncbi:MULTISPECIES: nucleoside permease [Flammeovirga]|uniref:Nucleoside permease n=1 Tax=Flammeovirga agarivorans TaxID=2726742 RepID=A0A7X8XUN8_9BACT|nr:MULTISPECIES: nucleoside permease [Flammeovirga]NLR90543.1 nucleoside permease [Flammeovirga agarivorans]